MTRLIDADTLIDSLNIRSATYNCIINKCIEDAPTIDAVEVVRCKDCKYWVESFKGCKRNPCVEAWHRHDFCSYGERREP